MFSSSTGPIVGGDGRVGAGPASGGTSVKSSGDWSTGDWSISRSAAARLRLVASPPPLRLRRRFVFTPSPSARVHNTPGVEDEPVPPPSRSETSLRDHNTPFVSGRAGWKLLVFCRTSSRGPAFSTADASISTPPSPSSASPCSPFTGFEPTTSPSSDASPPAPSVSVDWLTSTRVPATSVATRTYDPALNRASGSSRSSGASRNHWKTFWKTSGAVSDRVSAVRATAAVNAPPTNAPTPSSPSTSFVLVSSL